MPDLWKALGDVYGDADVRSVPVEPAADDRGLHAAAPARLDDDLAAALSAALVDGPVAAPVAVPVATAAPFVPPVVAVAPAPPVASAPVAPPVPAPLPAPAPVAPVATVADLPIVAVDGAQERVSTWLADIDARQRLREQGPPVAAIESVGHAWRRGDDDILPAKAAKRSRRKS